MSQTVDVLGRPTVFPTDDYTWDYTPPLRSHYKGHDWDRRKRNLVAPTTGTGVWPYVIVSGASIWTHAYGYGLYGSGPYGGSLAGVTVKSIPTPSNRRLVNSDWALEGGVTYTIGTTLHGILVSAGYMEADVVGYGVGGYGELGYGT